MKRFSLLLLLVFAFSGCPNAGNNQMSELTDADEVENTTPAHEHHHDAGPHGGHILEFGSHHGEIVMSDSRIISVYVLGDDAATAVPVAATSGTLNLKVGEEMQEIALSAEPQEGEPEGNSSRFVTAADALPESIKDLEDVAGSVQIDVAETPLKAEISHDHGHDHGHEH